MSFTLGRRSKDHKPAQRPAPRGRRPPIAAMALGTLLAAGLASALAWQRADQRLEAELGDRFSITQHVLSSEITRLRHIPKVIAEDPRLIAALSSPEQPEQVAAANAYLAGLRRAAEAEEVYLIGPDGVTIAASNWDETGSYLGMDYGFRPYFQDAMAKGEGLYYAIGVTTGRPGAFLSARIGDADGVAVIKVSLSALEQAWSRAGEVVAVADGDGVIFLSALPHWRFRSLQPITAETRERLATERRYDGLPTGMPLALTDAQITEPRLGRLRLLEGAVGETGWRLLVGLPVARLRDQAVLIALIVLAAGFFLSAFAYTIWQRRQILRLRLEEADRLELRVEERTRALALEIEERRRTEAELRRAQESLVQATKLAVLGRMSAAIVHEVGQSLSALDNNLAVSELHGRAGAVERLGAALDRSRRMVRRLQGVVTRLRGFGSRQVPVERRPVDLAASIAVAAEIVAPRAGELSVVLDLPKGHLPDALADAPRLEQVLANLLLNAIEAAALGVATPEARRQDGVFAQKEARAESASHAVPPLNPTLAQASSEAGQQIVSDRPFAQAEGPGAGARPARMGTVSLEVHAGSEVVIAIRDNGPGIPAERRRAVLEPFVSERAEGMGLGLYIVQSFLEQMGGRLELTDADGGGTLALIHLPQGPAP